MSGEWRLIKGEQLYNIKKDPGQENDVSDKYPEVVKELRRAHENWWDEISPKLEERCPIILGNEKENPTCLNSMDVMGDVAWNQCHIARARESTGKWWVEVEKKGKYRFSLRRWPEELDLSIDAGISSEELENIAPYEKEKECNKLAPDKAKVKIFDKTEIIDIEGNQKEITFEIDISRVGETQLEAWFLDEDNYQGAYYVIVERL